jgi:AcrR family transcriptional regulator
LLEHHDDLPFSKFAPLRLPHPQAKSCGRFDQRPISRTLAHICPETWRLRPLDVRAERSRAALLRAFVELMFRDGFEAVSVHSIVAAAGTARSTFYGHFRSKEDILGASMAHFLEVMTDCVSSSEQRDELTWVLAHFWENRRFADAVFTGAPRKIIARFLSDMIQERLRSGPGDKPLILPEPLAATQLAEGQLALVETWLRGRAFCRPEAVATALYRTSRASAVALNIQA